jgi:2-keto-4-pentenoate hydratase/2-oxohepta-3-ene-1,7-dioic acid hydratase in catechol pathway
MIEIPTRADGLFDYEGEPAVVVGKRGKDINAADVESYIWGVTLVIDWSVREEAWPPKPPSPLMPAKNFDCSKSIGPCVVVDEINIDDFQASDLPLVGEH